MYINQLSSIKRLSSFVLFTALLAFSTPVKAEDNTFTSAEFLEWERKEQDNFIQISVTMTSFLASQIDHAKKKVKCISDWYFPKRAEKNDFILDTMRKNSGYHPQAIILGVIEKQCGKF